MPWPAEILIDFSATGDNVVVPAVPGQVVKVFQLFLVLSADTNLTFKDGGAAFSGSLPMKANGSIVLDDNQGSRQADRPWFTSSLGKGFVISQSGTAQVSGRLYYTQGFL